MWEKWWSWMTWNDQCFIFCDLVWKVQNGYAVNRVGSFKQQEVWMVGGGGCGVQFAS